MAYAKLDNYIDEWNCIIFEHQHGSTFVAANSIELVIYVTYCGHTGTDVVYIDGCNVKLFTCDVLLCYSLLYYVSLLCSMNHDQKQVYRRKQCVTFIRYFLD